MTNNEPNNKDGRSINAYAKYSGLGFQMIIIIGGLAYLGTKIDQSAGHQTKWVAAVLALVGVFISLYIVIASLKK